MVNGNRRYIRILTSFIVSVLMIMLFAITVQATGVQVEDGAGVFSSDESTSIESSIARAEDETGWDIIVLTTTDAEGYTSNGYGELFYNNNKVSEDGVVLILDFDNGEKAIVTSGEAIYYLTDSRINAILSDSDQYSSSQDYAGTVICMCEDIELYYGQGANGNYAVNEDTGEVTTYKESKSLSLFEFFLALVVALGAGGGFVAFIVGKYRLKFGGYKYSFRANGTVDLKVDRDQFVNQFVTHRRIPRNNGGGGRGGSGGGRSSTHGGVGGGNFGGGRSRL